MYANCSDCNHHFLVTPDTVVSGSCPNCGGLRLERDQPSPTRSDGDLRNMVDPSTGMDMGGNPLQEGILGQTDGGWQPWQKRDESFASVQGKQPPLNHNYGTTMHNERTLNTDHYPAIWVDDPSWDEDNMRRQAGPLPALAPLALPVLGMAAKRILPSLMGSALGGIGSNMLGGMFGGGGASQAPSGPRGVQQLSHTAAGEDGNTPVVTPTSNPGYYHDNPEEVDTQEFDDGSTSTNPDNPNNDAEAGGATTDIGNPGNQEAGIGEDKPSFADDSPALERAEMLLPLLMHYHNSDQSGAQDPLIRELHELLESEVPGYLDNIGPEHTHAFDTWMAQSKEPSAIQAKTADMGMGVTFPMGGPPGGQPMGQQMGQGMMGQQMQQGPQGMCPYCGGTTLADGSCPQCGAKAQSLHGQQQPTPQMNSAPPGMSTGLNPTLPFVGRTAADTQGPITDEQKAAVSELLIAAQRHDEIPVMLQQPWNYVDELAQVAGRANVAPQLPPGQAPAQPPMDPSMMGGPPPGMPPGGDPSQMAPMAHVAADNIARRCPQCNSGTTGVINRNGDCRCHACGNVWQEEEAVVEKVGRLADIGDDSSPVQGMPSQDQGGSFGGGGEELNPEQSTQTWADSSGQPLQPGQQYEMHNPQYAVPDIVRIDQVKPDELVVTTIGEAGGDPNNPQGGMEYQHKVSAQELNTYGITFNPVDGGGQPGEQHLDEYSQQQGQPPAFTEPISQRAHTAADPTMFNPTANDDVLKGILARPDLQPHEIEALNVAMAMRTNNVAMQQARQQGWDNPTPSAPIHPIDHTIQDVPAPFLSNVEPQCAVCTSLHVSSIMSSPTQVFNECFKCGHAWESAAETYESDVDAEARNWLLNDSSEDFFANFERIQAMEKASGGQSRNIHDLANKDARYQEIKQRLEANKQEKEARLAGRNYSPREQRGFIDERGTARNSDLLDLEDTHYNLKDSWETKGNSHNAPDEHLFLGM